MEDFFDDVRQVDVRFNGGEGAMPIFYRDLRAMGVVIPANLLKMKRLIPDPRFAPLQVLPGVGAIVLAGFEYRETSIGVYNELMVGFVLNSPYHARVPGYNLVRQAMDRLLCAYVHYLPVSTEIALRAGVDYYGFPKVVLPIEFTDSSDGVTCELLSEGEKVMTIRGPRKPGRNLGQMRFLCNLVQYGKPQQAEIKANVVQGSIGVGGQASLDLDAGHPVCRELLDISLSLKPLGYIYAASAQAILYGPSNYSLPLLSHALKTARME